jgi:hypothetical protein
MTVISLGLCVGCGKPLPLRAPGTPGRPRKFCDDACKKRTHKRRRRRVVWSTTGELASIPTDPLTLQRRSLELLAEYLDGRPPAPVMDQLAQLLLELEQAVWTLTQLAASGDLPPQLAAPAGMLAEEMRAILAEFPGRAAA